LTAFVEKEKVEKETKNPTGKKSEAESPINLSDQNRKRKEAFLEWFWSKKRKKKAADLKNRRGINSREERELPPLNGTVGRKKA